MDLAEILKIAGGLVAILGTSFGVYVHFRARGRLRLEASLTDEKGGAWSDDSERNSLFLKVVNHGQETVVLMSFLMEFRPKLPQAIWHGYATIGILDQADPVELKAGHLYRMVVPLTEYFFSGASVLTGLAANDTRGHTFAVGRLRILALSREIRRTGRLRATARNHPQTSDNIESG